MIPGVANPVCSEAEQWPYSQGRTLVHAFTPISYKDYIGILGHTNYISWFKELFFQKVQWGEEKNLKKYSQNK